MFKIDHSFKILRMSQSLTKEERFLLETVKIAEERKSEDEELTDIVIDRNDIGFRLKINPTGAKSIIAQMIRGNLMRKKGEDAVVLTRTGIEIARALQSK